ncbi:MAG TPA: lytic transglycosylase domain-containing protein [Terriglobales bacterium]|nr:lytic transglycosylase domain-containing protein [Terriglobales bacterium]
MSKHLLRILMVVAGVVVLCPPVPAADIVPVTENGRTIFRNDRGGPAPTQSKGVRRSGTARLVPFQHLYYWDVRRSRWRKLANATPEAIEAARTAWAEAATQISARPQQSEPARAESAAANPNYANVERARSLTAAEVDAAIEAAAARHNVDPNLVRAVIKVESNFNPRAVSRKGAMGLMQLMPGTARKLKVSNPFDPEQNVDAGVRHLKGLMEDFGGDLTLSLAAYNAGAGAVRRNGGVPPYAETQSYVRQITRIYGGEGRIIGGPSYAPIRMRKTNDGKLLFSNVE